MTTLVSINNKYHSWDNRYRLAILAALDDVLNGLSLAAEDTDVETKKLRELIYEANTHRMELHILNRFHDVICDPVLQNLLSSISCGPKLRSHEEISPEDNVKDRLMHHHWNTLDQHQLGGDFEEDVDSTVDRMIDELDTAYWPAARLVQVAWDPRYWHS